MHSAGSTLKSLLSCWNSCPQLPSGGERNALVVHTRRFPLSLNVFSQTGQYEAVVTRWKDAFEYAFPEGKEKNGETVLPNPSVDDVGLGRQAWTLYDGSSVLCERDRQTVERDKRFCLCKWLQK